MAVNPTRNPGQVWVANTPPNKDWIVQLLIELIAGIDGVDPRAVPIYPSRANAVSGTGALLAASALPAQVTRILVQNGTALEIRARSSATTDPLYPSGDRWGVVQVQDVVAEAAKLAEAIRSGALIPLASIGGTGDAWTAQLAPSIVTAGITSLNSDATVEYIPALPNTAANPTGTISGTSFNIRNADGGAWPAFGFVVGRSYTLRRRGNVLRVIGDVAQPDLAAARTDRITGDAQMGSVMLEAIGGTGDAITGTVPTTLSAIGISAANIREILFTVLSANTTTGPTINIDGQGALQIRDYRDGLLPIGALAPGPVYCAVKVGARWRLVTSEVDRAALTTALATASATQQAYTDAGDLRIMSEDRTVIFVGAPRATIDANGAASSANVTNWVFPTPAAAAGDAGRFRAQIAIAGTIRFGVYRLVSGNLVRVRSRDVAVGTGFVDLPVGLHLEVGEFLGAFMGTARVRFVSGGGTGYYFDNATSDRGTIAASNLNTTNLLVAQFVVYQGSSPSVADREAQAATLAGLNGRVERLEYGGRDLQPFNMTDDARLADPAASAASAWNFVFDSLRPAGTVVRVEFWARAAGTLRLGAYVRSGSSFSRRAFVDVEAVVGFNRFEVDLEVRAGEYVGYKPFAAIVPFQSNSPLGTETGVWLSNNTADQGTFTGTQNLTQQHLIKITQAIGAAGGAAAAASAEQSEPRILSVAQTQTGNDVAVTVTVVNSAGAETTATGAFTIPATASTFRYDLIAYDHGTGALLRLAGTERNDAANVQPQVSVAGQQAVLRIRAGTAGITSIATVPEMVGAVPRASRALMDRALTAGRQALPRLMARIARGQPIRILGFGDSITQLRRGTGSAPTTTANGSDRDAITGVYLTGSGIYDAAAIAAIPVFTSVQLGRADDGAGAIHSRIGIIWGIVARLERRGYVLGTDLWYDNLGIAGTSSADAWDDATDLPKAWLSAVPTAGGAVPNVVVLALGMNERGYAAGREARYMKIVNWLRAQGIEVIILGVARAAATINDTRWTNAMLARVARRCDAAYIPLEAIWEDAVIGALGLNIEDVCHANRGVNANHPGTIELIRDGWVAGEIIP